MSIQGYIQELSTNREEQKKLRMELKKLRKLAKIAETNILVYLQNKEQSGLKFRDTAIIIDHKLKRTNKPKDQQKDDVLKVLQEHGINDPETVLNEIKEAKLGTPMDNLQLKIKKIKNK